MVHKSLAFIFRENYSELLCFEHPITSLIEVVRGTVENDENPQSTIIRELQEEAGIEEVTIVSLKLLETKVINVDIVDKNSNNNQQCYHGFLITLLDETFSSFVHKVISNGEDNGHIYKFQWYKFDNQLFSKLNPNTKRFLEEIKPKILENMII